MSAPTLVDFDEVVERFDPVLGLEVHVELSTNTKMFCGCPTEFGAEPNTQVCPVCLGLPGSLPVVNRTAVESAIRIGLALNCTIAPWGRFARKNYFYPDMPKNFQTSQYDEPIAVNGWLDVPLDDGTTVRVEIERAHMEEDTGKSLHVGGATGRIHGAEYSLLDYNRAGVPLIEIVTKMIPGTRERAPEVARAYVTALRDLLRALGVSDVRMDQGSMRCDVNLSLSPRGSGVLGTRSETKNVNSLRSVERAVRYEMTRQAGVLLARGEGRPGDAALRGGHGHHPRRARKETAEDYRYFPEPDLVPIAPPAEWVEELRATLPELPWERRRRIQAEWALTDAELRDLVNAGALDLIAATVAAGAPPAEARSWWVSYLAQQANTRGVELVGLPITPAQVARVIELVRVGRADEQARPPGRRRRAGRRGRAGRGRRAPRPHGRLGRRRPGRRRRRGPGGAAGRRGEDPRRQGGGGGRDRRRGDEGDEGPGRRQAGPRAGDRALLVARRRGAAAAQRRERKRRWQS